MNASRETPETRPWRKKMHLLSHHGLACFMPKRVVAVIDVSSFMMWRDGTDDIWEQVYGWMEESTDK